MPTFQGATIQKAIATGLEAMQAGRDQISVEVVQEGKKGVLGLGRKPAIVNLQLNEPSNAATAVAEAEAVPAAKPDKPKRRPPLPPLPEALRRDGTKRDDQTAIALVQSYLEDITNQLGLAATIDNERRGDQVWFDLTTAKDALLIGKHGKIINAIQFLAQTEFNHYGKSKWTIMLNVGDYRERRDTAVRRLAEKTAREVVARGTAVYLDPMPSFERKAIHQALADNAYVETHSEGTDPRRYVVITPRSHRSF